jgi:hypothetical protein
VLHDDYERFAVGPEVRYEEEEGDKALRQASCRW